MMLRQSLLLLALVGSFAAAPSNALTMETTRFSAYTDGFHATGSQVADWVKHHAALHFSTGAATRENLADASAVEAYQQKVREAFLRSLGGLPERNRNPSADAVETGRLERDGYHIRKLIHQSLPGVYVTSNLYVPSRLDGRAPAVLVGCGHSRDGKASSAYQRVCIDLVRAGFVVLIMDAPGHGEQVQCLDPDTGKPVVGTNTHEHSFLQLGASLTNHNVARYFIANAQSALDLLAALPEVDAERIGMTGNSGGGTLTQYLMVLDPRVKAAMPTCSVTTRASYLATGSRVYDGEQNLFGAISGPLDYADLLASFAPRPLLVGAAEYDFFAIEGVLDAVQSAQAVYRAAGAPDAIGHVVAAEQAHGFTTPLRRACVAFFARHLQGREAQPFNDEPAVETPEALQCTRSGQVITEFADARSMLDLFRDEWLAARSKAPTPTREALTQKLLPAAQPPRPSQPLRVRRTGTQRSPAGVAERVFFFSEPAVAVTAAIYQPTPTVAVNKAVLLLIPDGTEGQAPFAAEIAERVARGELVMVFDVRGTGAVRMHDTTSGKGLAFRSTEFRSASDHFMLGTSLAARRTYDVLRALEYLRGRLAGTDTRMPVTISGHGWPAIYGLLAAAVDGHIDAPTFAGLPASWLEAYELKPDQPERISPSLIAPELGGDFDIEDLLRLAGATPLL